MKGFWTRTLTATLCMLILVIPAMASDNELARASANDTPAGHVPADTPRSVEVGPTTPTGVNLYAGNNPAATVQPADVNPNYTHAMETQFAQGAIDCECSGTFEVGDRVMALVDSPSGASGIFAGDEGWVLCGADSSPDILVSWDGWTGGHDSLGNCVCPTIDPLPQTSGWFVNCDEISVMPAEPVDCVCAGEFSTGDRIVAAVDNPQGASGILAGHGGTVISGNTIFPTTALLISWDNWQSGHDGNGYAECPVTVLPDNSGWWVDCTDVDVNVDCTCAGAFSAGDRVTAVASNPQGATGIQQGRGGTVVCGTTAGFPSLLIQWDDWQSGHDGNGFCECPVDALPDNSGWFVDCPDVIPSVNVDCTCGGSYDTGDRVQSLVNNPDGNPDLFAGSKGTVIGGSTSFPDWLLVSWDGLTSGHTGGGTDCPVTPALDTSSGWWILCTEVGLVGSGPTDTIAATLDASPASGAVPFTTTFSASLTNLTAGNRRAAARINAVIASGSVFNNWRAGWTNLSAAEVFATSWGQFIPALPTVIGTNTFTLEAEDVTPAPFNQPPYAPSGDTDTDVATVDAF